MAQSYTEKSQSSTERKQRCHPFTSLPLHSIDKDVYNTYTMFIMNAKESVTRINSREARAKWRDLLDAIWRGSPGIVIERYGKPVAALVSYEDFEKLQQEEQPLRIGEPTAVYATTLSPTENLMNNETYQPLNELLQSLSADAQELVARFARLLQQQALETVVSTPTVTLPAAKLKAFSQLLPQGYAGDALADSEALYDEV